MPLVFTKSLSDLMHSSSEQVLGLCIQPHEDNSPVAATTPTMAPIPEESIEHRIQHIAFRSATRRTSPIDSKQYQERIEKLEARVAELEQKTQASDKQNFNMYFHLTYMGIALEHCRAFPDPTNQLALAMSHLSDALDTFSLVQPNGEPGQASGPVSRLSSGAGPSGDVVAFCSDFLQRSQPKPDVRADASAQVEQKKQDGGMCSPS